MPLEQNPYESPTQSGSETPVVVPALCAVVGAILCAIACSQTLSTIGLLLDIAANVGMLFRMVGSGIGLLVGLPLGAVSGWLVGNGKRIQWRGVAIGAISLCLALSATLFHVGGGASSILIILPLVGLFSGAVIGGTLSVLIPKSADS